MLRPLPHDGSLRERLVAAYRQACLYELDALKPGNVHRFSDGHKMTLEDFVTSADVSAEPLTRPGLGLGERIFRAVEATRDAVGCNTNLGILMLCAPLVHGLLETPEDDTTPLRERLRAVLNQADEKETEWLFRAIELASPGGLGESDRYDVRQPAGVPLVEAMRHAVERDLIARQYATGFADLFDYALPRLRECEQRWSSEPWALTGLYLDLLAHFPDTHIRRKHGLYKAVVISLHAASLAQGLRNAGKPEHYQLRLLQADAEFKREGINPGTSADMTVATVFLAHLASMLPAFEQKTGYSRARDIRPDGVGIRS
ncbi:MAG: triphosphoribosyl-dephospho-CoA synthase [Candidatus Thiodiazotropha sp.]